MVLKNFKNFCFAYPLGKFHQLTTAKWEVPQNLSETWFKVHNWSTSACNKSREERLFPLFHVPDHARVSHWQILIRSQRRKKILRNVICDAKELKREFWWRWVDNSKCSVEIYHRLFYYMENGKLSKVSLKGGLNKWFWIYKSIVIKMRREMWYVRVSLCVWSSRYTVILAEKQTSWQGFGCEGRVCRWSKESKEALIVALRNETGNREGR